MPHYTKTLVLLSSRKHSQTSWENKLVPYNQRGMQAKANKKKASVHIVRGASASSLISLIVSRLELERMMQSRHQLHSLRVLTLAFDGVATQSASDGVAMRN